MKRNLFITSPLTNFTDGAREISIPDNCGNIADALKLLWRDHPALKDRVMNELGEIRPHINIFHDGCNIRYLSGLKTPVSGEIHIFTSVSGG